MSQHKQKQSDDDKDNDRSMEYIPTLQQGNTNRPGLERVSSYLEDDGDSRSFFMSEPSISTEGDMAYSAEDNPSFLLSPQDSLSETDSDPKPPPAPQTFQSSPGNTSLSSRESNQNSFQNVVHLQFTQDHQNRPRLKIESTPSGPVLVARAYPRTSARESLASSRSTSSTSLGQQQRAAEFLIDLKRQSVGAVADAATNDYDSVPRAAADSSEIGAVMRRQHRDNGDETVVMTFSDSDVEKKAEELEPLDWEQQNSADDEKTTHKPRRMKRILASIGGAWGHRRSKSGEMPGHRRTRSGDKAAANLMTGGKDWKGMQKDLLPMPQVDDDDDTQDEMGDVPSTIRRTASGGSGSRPHIIKQARAKTNTPSEEEELAFSIGSSDDYIHQANRKNKKPPRQRRVSSDLRVSLGSLPLWKQQSPWTHKSPRQSHQSFGDTTRSSDSQGGSSSSSIPDRQIAATHEPISREEQNLIQMNQFNASFPGSHGHGEGLSQNGMTEGRLNHSFNDLPPNFLEYVSRSNSNRQMSPADSSLTNDAAMSWFSNRTTTPPLEVEDASDDNDDLQRMTFSFRDAVFEDEEDSEDETETSDNNESNVRANTFDMQGSNMKNMDRPFEGKTFQENLQHSFRPPENTLNGERRRRVNTAAFKPVVSADYKGNPTFVCPQCGTIQRSFFTVNSAPTQFEGPASYLAFYFGIYVISSLYIFGLEEGWRRLDCVYFAVITLTTTGLGDFVPTSDSAKIVCSIFIYFGVACIGLLLGTYLAGMMDERSHETALESRVDSCIECSRIKLMKDRQERRAAAVAAAYRRSGDYRGVQVPYPHQANFAMSARTNITPAFIEDDNEMERQEKRQKQQHANITDPTRSSIPSDTAVSGQNPMLPIANDTQQANDSMKPELNVITEDGSPTTLQLSPPRSFTSPKKMGSPMTTQILGRQKHTRHYSLDIGAGSTFFNAAPTPSSGAKRSTPRGRIFSDEALQTNEPDSLHKSLRRDPMTPSGSEFDFGSVDDEDVDTDTTFSDSVMSESADPDGKQSKIKTAKYVFLTLKQALMNSIVIIAVGGMGFYFIEKMTLVDSFYFTTVLLTTTGYGDIVPHTDGGKIFATIYVLVAGTVLLNNMSLISMIPLELRKRRIERAVLTQFGDQLDDAALLELAAGPLVQRLQLSSARSDGLAECTREMFALAMLVRLGKVTERDVRQTFAAFNRLDVDREGVLNSRTIITGIMHKRRMMRNKSAQNFQANMMANNMPNTPIPPPPTMQQPFFGPAPYHPPDHHQSPNDRYQYWIGGKGSLHVATENGTFRFGESLHGVQGEAGEQAALLGSYQAQEPNLGGTFPTYDEEEPLHRIV